MKKFIGLTKTIQIKKKTIEENTIKNCDKCLGKGTIPNPKMNILNTQIKCDKCNGLKYSFNSIQTIEKIEIKIDKGIKDKTKIVLKNKGDDIPYGEPGNINIIINELPHHSFYRKDLDLYYKCEISLLDSLCGFELDFEHLDKRKLIVKNQPGEITSYTKNIKMNNWEKYENYTITLKPFAKSDVTDIIKIKKSIDTGQLKDRKITAFKIENNNTYYYNQNVEEFIENMKECKNSNLFIKNMDSKEFKCIENEGMTNTNGENGNLYFVFDIKFPDTISNDFKNYLLNSELNI